MKYALLFFLFLIFHFVVAQKHVSKKESDLQVFIFMAVDCPVTQKYINTIKELSRKYSDQVTFTGYFPAGLSRKAGAEFRKEYDIPKSIQLKDDRKYTITSRYEATITPEVVLLDKNLKVVYQGAIDNWFFELGRYRLEITDHYLRNAIEATLQGMPPPVTKTEAIGCFIHGAKEPTTHEH